MKILKLIGVVILGPLALFFIKKRMGFLALLCICISYALPEVAQLGFLVLFQVGSIILAIKMLYPKEEQIEKPVITNQKQKTA